MLILVNDTETSGFPIWKEPSEQPNQPHIVECAALLYDDAKATLLDQFHCIVRPDGWVIPQETSDIHGITMERAMDEGIPEHEAIAGFIALHQRAQLRVAHNKTFDDRIWRIAMKRFGDGRATHQMLAQDAKDAIADEFKSAPSYCTMKASTAACALPRNKWPKLSEAYLHYMGKPMDESRAHGALYDAQCAAEVYFAINGLGEMA